MDNFKKSPKTICQIVSRCLRCFNVRYSEQPPNDPKYLGVNSRSISLVVHCTTAQTCTILVARLAPRPVPHWDPDLCHHSAQTCATLVPMPSWESIDRRRDAAAVPLSGLPALQCRAARRQPVFLAGTREPELPDPKSPAPPFGA